jgi:hypothetical protein
MLLKMAECYHRGPICHPVLSCPVLYLRLYLRLQRVYRDKAERDISAVEVGRL